MPHLRATPRPALTNAIALSMKSLLLTVVPAAPLLATVGELVAMVLAAVTPADDTAVVDALAADALAADAAAASTCLATAASMACWTPPQPVWAAAKAAMAKIRLPLMLARDMVVVACIFDVVKGTSQTSGFRVHVRSTDRRTR